MTAATTTFVPDAIDIYAAAHPQHVTRIVERTQALLPGAVAVIGVDRSTDTGSFYTGIHHGDRVVVTDHHEYHGHVSRMARAVVDPGTHLSLNDGHSLTPVDPADWTVAEAEAAQAAAEKHAEDLMERALSHATGWGHYGYVAPDGEDRAVEALRQASETRHYAFAVSHYVRVLKAVEQAARDPRYAVVLADRGMHAVA